MIELLEKIVYSGFYKILIYLRINATVIVYKIQTNREENSVIQAHSVDTHYKSMCGTGVHDAIFVGWVHTFAYYFLPTSLWVLFV